MIGVISSNHSQAYDRSRVFRPKSGIRPESRIRPESCLLTGVGHTTEVVRYLQYEHASWIIYDKRLANFLL
jgi:hypothetical protein